MPIETNSVATVTNNLSAWENKLIEYSIGHAGALISAVVVVVVGFFVARWLGKLTDRWLTHKAMEQPMRLLLVRITRLAIFALATVSSRLARRA